MSSVETTLAPGAAASSAAARHRVPTATMFAYAAPALGLYAVGLPAAVYLPPFYANDLGLGLAMVGQIFMLCRLFDLAADLGFGALGDRVRSRFGRRRVMLAAAVPFMGLGAWQMFMPPADVGPTHVLFWLVVMYTGYALGVISHMSWGAELSPDYHQRARIQGWREMAGIVGIVVLLALPALLEQIRGGTMADHLAVMGWFIIAIFPLGVLYALIRVPDPSTAEGTGHSHAGLIETFRAVAANPLVRRILLADLLAGVPPAVTGALFVFLLSAVMHAQEITATLLLGYFVAGIMGIPLWTMLSYRLGKHAAFAVGALWNCGFALTFLLVEPGNDAALVAVTLLYGLGYASGTFLLKAIMADVADEDELRTGHNRTGLFFGVLTMTNKVGFALAVGLTYPALEFFGFSPAAVASTPAGQPVPGTNALMAIYVFVPFAMNLAAAAIMARFPLGSARMAEVHRQLGARRQGS